jgi:hypothetical protein
MRSSLGVEVPALGAAMIHLTGKEAGEDRAEYQDTSEHGNGQQGIGKALHLLPVLPAADRPFVVIL